MSSVNVAVATACMGLVWTCMVLNGCFGERSECTCVDVGFFNPFALSIVNAASYLFACYKKHMTASRKEFMDSGFQKLRMLHLLLWSCLYHWCTG